MYKIVIHFNLPRIFRVGRNVLLPSVAPNRRETLAFLRLALFEQVTQVGVTPAHVTQVCVASAHATQRDVVSAMPPLPVFDGRQGGPGVNVNDHILFVCDFVFDKKIGDFASGEEI
jgi:hypothetical protein